jgi:hypothetical protein
MREMKLRIFDDTLTVEENMKSQYLLALAALCVASAIAPAHANRPSDLEVAMAPRTEAGFDKLQAQQLALNPQPEPPRKKAKKGKVHGPEKLNPQPEPPASQPMTTQPRPNQPK